MAEKKKNSNLPRWIGVIIGFTILWFIRGYFFPSEETTWYPSGEKKAQGMAKGGNEQGEWTYWYESGKTESVQNFEEGLHEGKSKWYYPDGTLKKEGEYVHDRGNGMWTFYYPDGKMQSTGHFADDEMVGKWKDFYESGTVKSEGEYEKGRPHGTWTYYYETGAPEATGKYDKAEESGLWTWYYENGKKSRELLYDSTGVKTMNAWNLLGELTVDNGEGTLFQYFPDSSIQSQSAIHEGKLAGAFVAYYENGALREKGINRDGVYVIQTFMDRKGQELVANGSGHYMFTTDKGVKVREGNYENGLQTGEWRTYQIDGSPLIISNFKDGRMNGQYVQFHQNGNIHSRGEMVEDVKNGQWTWFYDNGQKQSQKTFEMGKIVGEEKFWSEDGQVATVL